MINISFTGSRKGMTNRQKDTLEFILKHLTYHHPSDLNFHHGGAVGADEEAHDIALQMPNLICCVYPAGEERYNYWRNEKAGYKIVFYWKEDPLDRNEDIVRAGNILFAAPRERAEVLRSGTWSTIRLCKKKKKRCIILDP